MKKTGTQASAEGEGDRDAQDDQDEEDPEQQEGHDSAGVMRRSLRTRRSSRSSIELLAQEERSR